MTPAAPSGRRAARIRNVTIDCRDPFALSRFWAEALGFTDDPSNPNAPEDPEAVIIDPSGHHPGLLFLPVPEPKVGKNRLHVDLRPDDSREATVDRLLALGGTIVDDRRRPDGSGWVVMGDPEGNEFCVERPAAERPDEPTPADTGMRDMPPVHTADERTMLVGMLDWYRTGVVSKVGGVRPEHASAQPLRSSTSVAGLLKHLALVEDSWFTVRLAGRPDPPPWAEADWDADPDWEFHSAVADPLAELVALYEAACDRSRAVAAGLTLDAVAADPGPRPFTLRFAMLHLVEETARHLGHLDILREHLDGTIGE